MNVAAYDLVLPCRSISYQTVASVDAGTVDADSSVRVNSRYPPNVSKILPLPTSFEYVLLLVVTLTLVEITRFHYSLKSCAAMSLRLCYCHLIDDTTVLQLGGVGCITGKGAKQCLTHYLRRYLCVKGSVR
jgi:hypothetical protein